MRVVLTGGAGFIGSHLCDRLLSEGYDVLCVDNLLTGRSENIAHITDPRFQFLHHDITTPLFIDGPVDFVLHFASAASPVDYLTHPIKTLKAGALGTWISLGIAKAKGARYLLASTSEVYGDPEVSPQPESYWGRVNSIGPRGCYDEAKRFAEAITMAYHRSHGVNTGIARIFNSILADETVVLFNDDTAHIEPIGEYYASRFDGPLVVPNRVFVPAFNPETCRVEIKLANAVIKHASLANDAFLIKTRYGRRIRVTGDHSVFRRNPRGWPEAVPVRTLRIGDHVAIPGYLPVIERDVHSINIAEHLIQSGASDAVLWMYALISRRLAPVIEAQRELILDYLVESQRFKGSRAKRNSVKGAWRKYRREGMLPLAVVAFLRRRGYWQWPDDAWLRPYVGGGGTWVRNSVSVTGDLLWLLGLYLGEGCRVDRLGTYRLLFSSDHHLVERALTVLQSHFGVRPKFVTAKDGRSPYLYVDSKLLLHVFDRIFQIKGESHEVRIPIWIFQLPLSRVKHFLEGYREGDGTHTRYLEKRELAFNTVSEGLATDLTYLLLRFGVVASIGRYNTTFKRRYGKRTFPFIRLTVCEVSDFNILTWDQRVNQVMNVQRTGDLVWARVNEIVGIDASPYVYDFSVEGFENFVAGTGVFAHNTYGPRLRPGDGRVIPNFLAQALRSEALTIYGDGVQTRSFCYVDDTIEGIVRLMRSEVHDPVNLGNPEEVRIIDVAHLVLELTRSRSSLVHRPRPQDDPSRRCPEISRARQLLGWEPRVSLRQGLLRTIDWFTSRVERPA